jgi:hypothetical protein
VVTVSVQSAVLPSVSISTNSIQVCQNSSANINVAGLNLGSNPKYFWLVNRSIVDTSNSFNYSGLQNGDTVQLRLKTNMVCQLLDSIVSNTLIFNVIPKVNPAVSFALPNNALCAAKTFTFLANPINGGPSPSYSWKKNGTIVSTSQTYQYMNPVAGDLITVEMTANNTCQNYNTAIGNLYSASVIPAVVPSLSFSNLPSGPLCTAKSFVFQTNSNNTGSNPIYIWKINQNIQSANTASFQYASPINGQVVSVSLIPNNVCQTVDTLTINTTIQALSALTPQVSLNTTSNTICEGTAITLTANPNLGGPQPSFIWEVNGLPVSGISSNVYVNNTWSSGPKSVIVKMIANNVCQTSDTVTSNVQNILVNPIPNKPSITRQGVSLLSSSTFGNQWYLNGQLISGATNNTYNPTQFGIYTVNATSNGCTSVMSDTVMFIPTGVQEPSMSQLAYFPNPTGDFVNLKYFNETPGKIRIHLMDMLGREVRLFSDSFKEIGQIEERFDVTDLNDGLYFIKLDTEQRSISLKLRVQK